MRRYAIQKGAVYSLRDAARSLRLPVSQVRRAILLNDLSAIEVSDDRQYLIQGEDLETFLRVLEPRAIIEDGHLNAGGDSIWAIAVLILIPLLALVSLIIGVLAAPASNSDAPASPGPKASSPQVLPEYGSELNMPPELNPSNQHEDPQRLQKKGEFTPREKSASPLPDPSPLYKGCHRLDLGPAEVMEYRPRDSRIITISGRGAGKAGQNWGLSWDRRMGTDPGVRSLTRGVQVSLPCARRVEALVRPVSGWAAA